MKFAFPTAVLLAVHSLGACVMYYLHESAADLIKFLQRFNQTSDPVLFGQKCLDDAHAASLREL